VIFVNRKRNTLFITIIGFTAVAIILVIGTLWIGDLAKRDTEKAVNSVSLLYLDELAGRREQVVSSALEGNIKNMQTAVGLLTKDDLSDIEHLQAYQARMKKLYTLDKFAFVDTSGVIYTSVGTTSDIDTYNIDPASLSKPCITLKDTEGEQKKVIIAIPVENISVEDHKLVVCFMEIDINTMLEGVSLQSSNNDTTFCNIYTKDGAALTDMVLGGLAKETNLLEALERASFENGDTVQEVMEDFANGTGNVVSFTYNGIKETLSYKPIAGTDWMLTYLIRESVISDKISSVSDGIILRNLVQTGLTIAVLFVIFIVIFRQNKANTKLALEKQTSETESRIKQQELEQRLELQNRLLEEEKQRTRQDHMITALASDYTSVYYVDLDTDESICYSSKVSEKDGPQSGEKFSFKEGFTRYANERVAEGYREGFLDFIKPENIQKRLESEPILSYRYLTVHDGRESYEMLRLVGVRRTEKTDGHTIHAIGAGFSDIDSEMRASLEKNQALSDALAAAENASKAKTAFLSSMSHEIRTPMNAIIGLDNIALSDPELSEKTREYLVKIGGSANHLLELINDILDMSRIESGRMVLKNEDFSFTKLMEQINTIFSAQCEENEQTYSCRVQGEIDDHYIGDNTRLRQVLINILGNAVKFTAKGGNIDFCVERTAKFGGRSTLRFTITDNGIGMSKEYIPHIFDTFSQEDSSATNKYGSSGLGLAITKNIVDMMNGNIEVRSEKGKGTTFIVTVTLTDSPHKDSDADYEQIQPYDMKVLAVDDDPIACEHAKLVLEKAGMSCDTVLSGAQAIEAVRVQHARHELYDLILIDLKMPEMDGVETAKRLRDIVGPGSAIIIITAYKWDDVLEEAVKAGVDSFISKPISSGSVLEEFRSASKRKHISEIKQHKADLNGKHILLAEDVQINADIMEMVLKSRGMTVDHEVNGRLVLERFAGSEPGYYDAILMDVRMPEMDGLEATAAIRRLDRPDAASVPIIALTANAFDEDVQRSLQAGMNAHLTKPIDNEALYSALETLIRQ